MNKYGGLAQLKREGAYYIDGVEVTEEQYDAYVLANPKPKSKRYSLLWDSSQVIDTEAYDTAIKAIRSSETDNYNLLSAIANEILKNSFNQRASQYEN